MVDFLRSVTKASFLDLIYNHFSYDTTGKKLGIDYHDDEMKDLTLNLALIRYENSSFMIGSNIRYPKGYPFEEIATKTEKLLSSNGFEYVRHHNSPVHYVSPQDELVKTLYGVYQKYTNDTTTPLLTIGGGTYARALKKAVAFGPNLPGKEDLAHQPDEYLVIDDMVIAMAIYAESITLLAGENA